MTTLVLIAALAAGLTPLILRDLRRAVERRRRRVALRRIGAAAVLAVPAFNAFAAAAVRAAADMEATMAKISATMRATRPTDGDEAREVGG